MAILKYGSEEYTVDHAVKGADYIHGYDKNGVLLVSFDGVHDFSLFSYDEEYMLPEHCLEEPCTNVKYIGNTLTNGSGKPIPASAVGAGTITNEYTGIQKRVWHGPYDEYVKLDENVRDRLIPHFTDIEGAIPALRDPVLGDPVLNELVGTATDAKKGLHAAALHKLTEPGVYLIHCVPAEDMNWSPMPASGIMYFHESSFVRAPFLVEDGSDPECVCIATTPASVADYVYSIFVDNCGYITIKNIDTMNDLGYNEYGLFVVRLMAL